MRVDEQPDGRVLFLVKPGERFKWLKWIWHSFWYGYRRDWSKRR